MLCDRFMGALRTHSSTCFITGQLVLGNGAELKLKMLLTQTFSKDVRVYEIIGSTRWQSDFLLVEKCVMLLAKQW